MDAKHSLMVLAWLTYPVPSSPKRWAGFNILQELLEFDKCNYQL